MKKPLVLVVPLFLLLTGCSYYLSGSSRALADPSVTFFQLRQDVATYRGRLVLLGGTVTALHEDRQGTRLEIEQHNLDKRNLPDESIPSGGHFLAITTDRLDPAQFAAGTLVTLAGTVTGVESRPLGDGAGNYPVVTIKEIHDIVIEQETHWGSWGGV